MLDGKFVLAEVGVGPLGMAYGALLWDRPDIHLMMFEPLPRYFDEVKAAAGARTNVALYNVAIGDEAGEMEFFDDGTSSSLAGVASPFAQHGHSFGRKTKIKVPVRRISDFDLGQIDALRIDTEGAEWFCLKHLVSRPREIVVEIYNDLGTYVNPFLLEINDWATRNGYKLTRVADADFTYQRA